MSDIMIERVARALCAVPAPSFNYPHCVAPNCSCWEAKCLPLARAAIAAMREPTTEILLALGEEDDPRKAWDAAIDAALAEPEDK